MGPDLSKPDWGAARAPTHPQTLRQQNADEGVVQSWGGLAQLDAWVPIFLAPKEK